MKCSYKDGGEKPSSLVYKILAIIGFGICLIHAAYTAWSESERIAKGGYIPPATELTMYSQIGISPKIETKVEETKECCLCENDLGDSTIKEFKKYGQCEKGCLKVKVNGRECSFYKIRKTGADLSCKERKIKFDAGNKEVAIAAPGHASPCANRLLLSSLETLGHVDWGVETQEETSVEKGSKLPADTKIELEIREVAEKDFWTCGPDNSTPGHCAAAHFINNQVVRTSSEPDSSGSGCSLESCNAMFERTYAQLSPAFFYNRLN